MQGNTISNRLTVASTLAQDKLEDLTKMGYGNTAVADTTVTEEYNSILNFPFYKRVTTTDVGNPAAGMKTVTVTIFLAADVHSVAPSADDPNPVSIKSEVHDMNPTRKTNNLSLWSACSNEKGIVLAVVLMFLAILAVMGSITVVMTRSEIKIGDHYKNSEMAFFAA